MIDKQKPNISQKLNKTDISKGYITGSDKPKSSEGKGVKIEDKLEQDIIAGRKVILYDDNDCTGVGVEGYDAGQEYEVDEVRIRPTWGVQIFLKGNIHSYPIKSFINHQTNH